MASSPRIEPRPHWQRVIAPTTVPTMFPKLGKVRFLLGGGGGWAGALEEKVISKYFTNWGGSNLFDTQPGEGHSFLLARKILLHVG